MADKLLAVISVQGRDQKGVVAQFATFVADRGINIEDLEQRVVSGLFVMDMLVDLREMTVSLDELITGALELGQKIGMEVKVTLQRQPRSKRVVVLASKEPHCLEKLLASSTTSEFHGTFAAILSNHPSLKAHADKAGIAFEQMPADDKAAHMKWLLARLRDLKPDLIVLARYMQILSNEFCENFTGRVINIHHSFLPGFKGAKPYAQAYERGVKIIGATAHFATADLDEGPIIAQETVHVDHTFTPQKMQSLGRDTEARVLAQAIRLYGERRVFLHGKRTVIL